MKLRFTSDAERELDVAISFYNLRAQGLGQDFAQSVDHAGQLICEYPNAWKRVGKFTRQIGLTRFPYGLVYLLDRDEAVIVAVAYLRRKPGYWRKRVKKPREV